MVAEAMASRRPPLHRAWQFFRALFARPLAPAEWEEIELVLTGAQQALFLSMSTGDQRHSLHVMRTLLARGKTSRDLLTAGLLHDVGKSRCRLRLSERPVVVLIQLCRPITARRWGTASPDGWRRPFVVYEQHPEWGAAMAAAASCTPLTTWLIRHHQNRPETLSKCQGPEVRLLQALQGADNAN
jgi:hypothetical protein